MKNPLKNSLFLLLIAACATYSQTLGDATKGKNAKPNYAGVWKLNKQLSSPQKDLKDVSEAQLEISNDGTNLRVVRTLRIKDKTATFDDVYRTDGRSSKIPKFRGGSRKARTFWTDDAGVTAFPLYKLISEYTIKEGTNTMFPLQTRKETTRSHFEQKVREIWYLWSDGQTLTITTEYLPATISLGPGEMPLIPGPRARTEIKVFYRVK